MEIKWYGLAELLGLVENISAQFNDGATHYKVQSETGTVFFWLHMALLLLLFATGFFLQHTAIKRNNNTCKTLSLVLIGLLCLYAFTSVVGIGPYISFYPQGGSFIDFDILEHILQGIFILLYALCVFLGGKLAGKFKRRTKI